MGKPIPYETRVKIVARKKKGQTSKSIAAIFNLSLSGVNKIVRQYKKEGETAFQTRYANCGRASIYTKEVRTEVATIRDNNQGAYYVRSKMVQRGDSSIPSARTMQRWWVQAQTNRTKGRPSDTEKKLGVKSHMIPGK